MSNINREQPRDNLTSLLRFYFHQWAKSALHTSRPGLIETFDAETRRARVKPALRMVLTGDAPGEDGDALEPSPWVNVPVIFPSGGGVSLQFPIAEGDPVLLIFSERGLTQFKETFELSTPDKTRFFDASDAIAIPSFGTLSITPASTEGAALQSDDGETFVEVTPERVKVKRGDQELELTDSGLNISIEGAVTVTASGEVTVESESEDVKINVPMGKKVYLGSDGAAAQELVTRQFLSNYYNLHTHIPGGIPNLAFRAPLTSGTDITRKVEAE